MNSICENIRNRIWELDMTQEQLAIETGMGKSSINRIVNGDQTPTLEKIEIIAKALNTLPAILCGWISAGDDADDGKHGYNLQTLANRAEKKGNNVEVFLKVEEVVPYLVRRCEGRSVGLGSSVAFGEMGFIDALQEKGIELSFAGELRRDRKMEKKAINASVFILSVGGISYKTGDMVTISSNSNRIAGAISADEVIYVIGKNRIAPDLDGAIEKTKTGYIAKIAKSGGYRTPCAETGKCGDCTSPDRLCRGIYIQHNPPFGAHSTVVLVDEKIGY